MFRDRVVSMEQTLERGEKLLDFLKSVCREVFAEFEYREHVLDHERDLFVMILEAPDGRRKSIGWTRMVLFDQERLPVLVEDPSAPLGEKLKHYLRERASQPDIVVTFRHMEEGWTDTPEPRRDKRKRRRGRHPEKREGRVREPRPEPRPPDSRRPAPPPTRPRPSAPGPGPAPAAAPSVPGAPGGAGRRRRRRFRRRRGRGGSGAGPAGPAPSPGKTS